MLLDGKKLKNEILDELKNKIKRCDRKPGFVVIQIGEDSASTIYVRQKEKMADYLGMHFEHVKLSNDVSEDEVLKIIEQYNQNNEIDWILVQLPIPNHLNELVIQNKISPDKDVDGLTHFNAGCLMHGKDALFPCTPLGIVDLLENYKIKIKGKHVVIVGRSNLVGKPLMHMMLARDATVTICHSKTEHLETYTRMADILVVAIGKKAFIKAEMVKERATVIDVGINRDGNQLYGDVDFDDVCHKVHYITPVPGGIGQMTVAELAKNVYHSYIKRCK